MKKLFKSIPLIFLGIIFTVLTANAAIAGDINANGSVDIDDARLALRQAIELKNKGLTDTMVDMTDYNYDGITDINDAQSILSVACGSAEEQHYFAKTVSVKSTCTDEGQYTRTCTECTEHEAFTQTIQPTGHILTKYKTVSKPTCTKEGTVQYKCKTCKDIIEQQELAEHTWKDATCTKPMTCKVCKLTIGTENGHSVRIGYCSVCKKYVSELATESKAIIAYLNSALKHIKNASDLIDSGAESEFTNVLIDKWNDASDELDLAKTDFTDAYNTCFEETEFAAAKKIIGNLSDSTSSIIEKLEASIQNLNKIEKDYKSIIKKNPSKATEKNKKILAAVSKSLKNTDNYFDKINTKKYDLKEQTDKWKK